MAAQVGQEVRSSSNKERKMPKVLRRMEVTPSENGGASVEHHFTDYEHAPEMHTFGPDDGKAFVEHMLIHTGIKHDMPSEPEAENETGGAIPEKA